MISHTEVLRNLRAKLKRAADPKKAPQMQSYMKSEMPYHGVQVPLARKIAAEVFSELNFSNSKLWQSLVLAIWRNAEFREERYAALALAADRRAIEFQTPLAMKMYEELIVTGAWWDYVDDIAIHRVGKILKLHELPMKTLLSKWSRSENFWKRRTAILSQIEFKTETDLDFLYACIEPSLDSDEFFLRKAIGWALRQYAWSNPGEIIRYVEKNRDRLSPLSKREALKNVIKSGKIKTVP